MGLLVSLFSMRYSRIAMLARFACVLLGFVMIAGALAGRLERWLLRWRAPSGFGPSDI